jgi:hypothetical protein
MPDAATPPKIVVGVDGSPLAHAALEFAIDEARLRGASLQVTYAYPVIGSHITGSTGHDYYEQVEGEARALLQGLIAGAPSTEGIETEWLAVPGQSFRSPHRGQQGGRAAGGWFEGCWWIPRTGDGFGVDAVRALLTLPGLGGARRALIPRQS